MPYDEGRPEVALCPIMMQENCNQEQQDKVEERQVRLEQILAAQPLNPLRQLEFRVLPLNESHDN